MLDLDHESAGNAEPRSQRRGTGTAQSKHRREQVTKTMRQPGSIVLISCYELGHQPLGLASPLGFLARGVCTGGAGHCRGEFDERLVGGAEFVGVGVPMHTAHAVGRPRGPAGAGHQSPVSHLLLRSVRDPQCRLLTRQRRRLDCGRRVRGRVGQAWSKLWRPGFRGRRSKASSPAVQRMETFVVT